MKEELKEIVDSHKTIKQFTVRKEKSLEIVLSLRNAKIHKSPFRPHLLVAQIEYCSYWFHPEKVYNVTDSDVEVFE